MIDHSGCEHERSSKARAKCRKARAKGEVHTDEGEEGATPKVLDFTPPEKERNRGTTPRDRDKQCDVCGIERIQLRGTDPITNMMIYVGERCAYYLKGADDVVALP